MTSTPSPLAPLSGVRIVSLALNLPGPAALMRCRQMGARCLKLEPPAGDPMPHYSPGAYRQLHEGVELRSADLKTEAAREALHEELAHTDVLITSFRPSALRKLGLDWERLHARHPRLSKVAIVGAAGARAEEPGHDLTYQADAGLVPGTALPPSLFADMAGALQASEAVLQAVIHTRAHGSGVRIESALHDAAQWLALPLAWGLTTPAGVVGGAHAGYRVYPCADGRVAVAALEPHFAQRLGEAAGAPGADLLAPATHRTVAAWLARTTRAELDALAAERDIPIHTMAG